MKYDPDGSETNDKRQTIDHSKQKRSLSSIVYGLSSKFFLSLLLSSIVYGLWSSSSFALIDTYHEPFDNRQEEATIDGVDSWVVSSGAPNHAMPMSGSTAEGSGKSLKITGAPVAVDVARPDNYGNLTPTWIETVVKPGQGRRAREIPGGIGAVSFSEDGNVMAADGGNWINTGQTYDPEKWYRVILKLNFSDHLYDLYISPADQPKSPFSPDKQNLHFTDPTTGTLSRVGLKGSYVEPDPQNPPPSDTTYLDDLVIHTIEKIQFTSGQQTIVDGYPSHVMTVQLQNTIGEAQTAWTDLTLELKSSSINGEFSVVKEPWKAISQIILPQGAQGAEFYYKDTTVAKPLLTVREAPDRGWTDGIQEENVVGVGKFFQVSAVSPQVAGRSFAVEIAAQDATGQTDPFYNGTVDIFASYVLPESGTRILMPETAGPFVMGTASVSMTYPDAGVVAIMVRDQNDSSKLGASANLTFLPDHFEVRAGQEQKTSRSFPLEIRAFGADGLETPNYKGPAEISVTPVQGTPGLISPSEVSNDFSEGTATVQASYDSWGRAKIKVTDKSDALRAGESGEIRFTPTKIEVHARPPSVSREFFYKGERVYLDIDVLDAEDVPIANFEGPMRITPTPEIEGLLPETVFVLTDKGKKTVEFTASKVGTFNISAALPDGSLKAETGPFDVVEATVVVVSKAAPVGTTELELRLVDSQGRRITDSAASITIVLEEEFSDGSVFLSEPGKPVLFDKGLARIVIGNSQAETVTIGALSDMGFKIKKGTITFGRVGAGGVGTLMLRESKDEE